MLGSCGMLYRQLGTINENRTTLPYTALPSLLIFWFRCDLSQDESRSSRYVLNQLKLILLRQTNCGLKRGCVPYPSPLQSPILRAQTNT